MTPISATGCSRACRRRGGFTLVELMVTITIVGLAAGAVMLAAPRARPAASFEAERLAARLQRAREEALLTNRVVAVDIDGAGYRFSALDASGWTPLAAGPFGPAAWPDGAGLGTTAAVRVAFDPTGAAAPAVVRLGGGRAARAITIDAAGEVRLED